MTVKISDVIGGDYRPSRYGRVYERERVADVDRLRVGYDDAPDGCALALAGVLAGPFTLLYVLHTTRTGAALGRYQSPELSREDVDAFFRAFGRFVAEDARHNIIYAYGPLDLFEEKLQAYGVVEGQAPDTNRVHAHHYHADWDEAERAVLSYGDWEIHPLQPSDVQFEGGLKPEA